MKLNYFTEHKIEDFKAGNAHKILTDSGHFVEIVDSNDTSVEMRCGLVDNAKRVEVYSFGADFVADDSQGGIFLVGRLRLLDKGIRSDYVVLPLLLISLAFLATMTALIAMDFQKIWLCILIGVGVALVVGVIILVRWQKERAKIVTLLDRVALKYFFASRCE